ncbi:MAG: hypothetical protein AB1847_21160 [bacterium]
MKNKAKKNDKIDENKVEIGEFCEVKRKEFFCYTAEGLGQVLGKSERWVHRMLKKGAPEKEEFSKGKFGYSTVAWTHFLIFYELKFGGQTKNSEDD